MKIGAPSKVKVKVTREQIEDLEHHYGIDAVAEIENSLADHISRTDAILSHFFFMRSVFSKMKLY